MSPSNHSNGPGPGETGDSPPPPNPDQDHRRSNTDTLEEAKLVRSSGRGIHRLVTLCGTVSQLVAEYDRHHNLLESNSDDDDDGDDNDDDVDGVLSPEKKEEIKRRRNRDYQSYLELVKLIPSLKDKIADSHEGSRMLYYARLTDGANNARSDDISRAKSSIAGLLNSRKNTPINPSLDVDTRDGRGLQNDFTGRLLCPIKYDWDDLGVRAKIRDGIDGHNAFDDYWLHCLYEGEKGDPEDVEKGFLKSTLLVKTFQMIFTSPSSARGNLDAKDVPEPQAKQRKTPSKRPPVATQLKMDDQVTARAIAYAAVQLLFALNDATHWMSHYNGFNFEEFYEFIIDFFEEDQSPEGKAATNELFNWWNRRVFPRSAATRATSTTSARRSSLTVVRRQRQARSSH